MSFGEAGEQLDRQQLVAQARAEALTYGFCHDEPGSMYALPAREKRHQSRIALAVSSEPLSHQMNIGGVPRWATRRSRVATSCRHRSVGGTRQRVLRE
jgi:hypothetical protein